MFLRKRGHIPGALDGLPDEHGGEEGFWINADPIPGCIVCNIGESEFIFQPEKSLANSCVVWEVWTNGLYKSTLHRVVHRGANYRSVTFRSLEGLLCRADPFAASRALSRRPVLNSTNPSQGFRSFSSRTSRHTSSHCQPQCVPRRRMTHRARFISQSCMATFC